MHQKVSLIENNEIASLKAVSGEEKPNGKEGGIAEIRSAEKGINAIHKGSKVSGNLVITQDLQITGDIEGNITGENNSSIFIKGACKGNIRTGGSVEIEGTMSGGDIIAGGYVKVTGKFNGGKIQAKEKIHINGEFGGSLESNEVEVGASARGKGEIFYRETLCIEKGANVEGKIARMEAERKSEVARKEDVRSKKGFFAG